MLDGGEERQLVLPLATRTDAPARPATHQARFEAFCAAHPEVLERFVELADQAVQTGRARASAKFIIEQMRAERCIRIDNSHTSRFARALAKRRPDLADLFETRRLSTP